MITWKNAKFIYSASLKDVSTPRLLFKRWEAYDGAYKVIGDYSDLDNKISFKKGTAKINMVIEDPDTPLLKSSEILVLSSDLDELKKFISNENFNLTKEYFDIIMDSLL